MWGLSQKGSPFTIIKRLKGGGKALYTNRIEQEISGWMIRIYRYHRVQEMNTFDAWWVGAYNLGILYC